MGVPLSRGEAVYVSLGPRETVASIEVDAQYGFTPTCPNELPVPGGLEIVPELNRQAKYAAVRIGSKDAHPREAVWVASEVHPMLTPVAGQNVDVRWPVHCVPGSKGFEWLKGLPNPAEYDFFVWKGVEPDLHPYGACFHDLRETLSTGVIEFLICRKIQTVLVGGLATDYCVKTTALQLRRAGFRVIVNLGACRALSTSSLETATAQMQSVGIIIVASCDAFSEQVEVHHA